MYCPAPFQPSPNSNPFSQRVCMSDRVYISRMRPRMKLVKSYIDYSKSPSSSLRIAGVWTRIDTSRRQQGSIIRLQWHAIASRSRILNSEQAMRNPRRTDDCISALAKFSPVMLRSDISAISFRRTPNERSTTPLIRWS